MDQDRASALIGRVYDAALTPECWPDVLAEIAAACGAHTGILYEFDGSIGRSVPLGALNLDPALVSEYERYYSNIDVWNRRAFQRPVGEVSQTHKLISDRELLRTEFYNDHLRRIDVFYGTGGAIAREGAYMALIGVQRVHRRGRFEDDESDAIRMVMPHLRRAVRIRRHLGTAVTARANMERALDALDRGVILVDRDARVQFANRNASALLDAADGVTVEAGRLAGATPVHTNTLRFAIMQAIDGYKKAEQPGDTCLALPRASGGMPLVVVVAPLRTGFPIGLAKPLAVLLIHDRDRGRVPFDHFCRQYRLTPAESRLARGLADGRAIKALAESFGVSVYTLRVQLRSIFAKTGVHRQADLMRLISAAEVGSAPPA